MATNHLMDHISPQEYLFSLKEKFKDEIEKVNGLKQKAVQGNNPQLAGQYRDIENKLLHFICTLEQCKPDLFPASF